MNIASVFRITEKATFLDPVSDPLSRTLRKVLDGTAVDGLLRGEWLDHPVHPVAASATAGFWSGAVLLDVLGKNPDAARTLIGAGLVTAPTALITGWSDWSVLDSRQRRVGMIHAGTNVVALNLFLASYRRRAKDAEGTEPDATAKALALGGVAMAGLGGALGGHLAYAMGANMSGGGLTSRLLSR